MRKSIDIQAEIAIVEELSRDELCQRWRQIYGQTPPKGVRRELMIRAVAWHLQAKQLGGYSNETRRLLRSAVLGSESKLGTKTRVRKSSPSSLVGDVAALEGMDAKSVDLRVPLARARPRPGARLLRDWNGKTHVVDVIENGFVFEAKLYASLSAIARKITGAHWSGPRFFGL